MAPSSSEVGSRFGGSPVDSEIVPSALRERLGADGTDALMDLLENVRADLREDFIKACTERFERRLVEEVSAVRVQLAQVESSIRQDMSRMNGEFREAMAGLRADLLDRMSSDRFDLLKWAFLFWIGQVAAIATLMGVMMRTVGR